MPDSTTPPPAATANPPRGLSADDERRLARLTASASSIFVALAAESTMHSGLVEKAVGLALDLERALVERLR